MVWSPDGPVGNEAAKIRHLITPYTVGRGLDLGCGPWKAWPHFLSVDDKNEWGGVEWNPDINGDCTDLSMFSDASMDFVFSSHTLEHIEDTEAALREWWRVIKPGGHLVLYLPHKDFYPNIGEHGANPDHKHDFLPSDIEDIMRTKELRGWTLVYNEDRNGGNEYSFLQAYRKSDDSTECSTHLPGRFDAPAGKRLLVIRYGGLGDALIASSVFPLLKDQGWHLTVQTAPEGGQMLLHNPYVDDLFVQAKNQVPNMELQEYWKAWGDEFDKVINLSESMEGILLTMPGRRNHAMPHGARHLLHDVNYHEILHELAEVPHDFDVRFHETPEERKRAKKIVGDRKVILWSMSGSSVHKAWPWGEQLMASILIHTDYTIVTCGDALCQYLERGMMQVILLQLKGVSYEESNTWSMKKLIDEINAHFKTKNNARRIICLSGQEGIRGVLAIAQQSDIVLGPETGVLNAVSMDPDVHKIVMLSHSSENNLTRHWKNTNALMPSGLGCYPCHRLHYTREFCHEDPNTGAAMCASLISSDQVFRAILEYSANDDLHESRSEQDH